jgi:hypothetical protein
VHVVTLGFGGRNFSIFLDRKILDRPDGPDGYTRSVLGLQVGRCGASMLQAMLDDHDLVHLNDDGSLTRIAAAPQNKSSAIDLTLGSSDMYLGRHCWMVFDNATGSDHLPILTSLQTLEIPTKFFLPVFDVTRHISWSAFADTVFESLPRITDEMSLCGAYAIFMEIFSGTAISAQTRTPGGYRGRSVQKAMWWDNECNRAKQKLMAFRELRELGGSESYINCETNLRNLGKQKKAEAWRS